MTKLRCEPAPACVRKTGRCSATFPCSVKPCQPVHFSFGKAGTSLNGRGVESTSLPGTLVERAVRVPDLASVISIDFPVGSRQSLPGDCTPEAIGTAFCPGRAIPQ